jgi:hypothetical protein
MPKVTAEPSAPASARKTDRNTRRTAKTVRKEEKLFEHDEAKEIDQFVEDAKERILMAAYRAAEEVTINLCSADEDHNYCDAARVGKEVYTLVALAAEAAAAKAAGYETWAAFEAAKATDEIGDLA